MRYRMDDGAVVDTANATHHYKEARDHDGRNMISRATGSQWNHEDLYRSRNGQYYVIHSSPWQYSRDHCEWISPEAAARWLLANDHDLPDELAGLAEEISE